MKEFIKGGTTVLHNNLFYSLMFSIVIPLTFWVFKPDLRIPLAVFLIVVFLLALFIIILINSMLILYSQYSKLKAQENSESYTEKLVDVREMNDYLVFSFTLDKSDTIYSFGLFVTFFVKGEHDSEYFLGVGEVMNVQDDKSKFQVKVLRFDAEKGMIDKLKARVSDTMATIVVKPYLKNTNDFGVDFIER